jgi:hypothetical protein
MWARIAADSARMPRRSRSSRGRRHSSRSRSRDRDRRRRSRSCSRDGRRRSRSRDRRRFCPLTGTTMATAALDRALLDMDAARKAFETAAVQVSRELEQLQQRVTAANGKLSTEREHTAQAVAKRRHRSGSGTGAQCAAAEAEANSDKHAERHFNDAVSDADERLQTATRAMARVHAATQSVRASVDAAKVDAIELISAKRMAAAKEARNDGCSELMWLMGRVDLGGTNHAKILQHLGVVSLWWVRGVSRGFRRWATSAGRQGARGRWQEWHR